MKRRDLLLGLLALLLLWQLIAWIVNDPILPGPILVGQTFVTELGTGLAEHFLVSAGRVLISVILAVAVAAPAGLILGQSKRLNRAFSPVIYMLYPIPNFDFITLRNSNAKKKL